MDRNESSEESLNEAYRRRDAYQSALSSALLQSEDGLPKKLRTMNASAHSKLRKIYALVGELTASAGPFIACAKGCAACCHMNVTISEVEAKIIANAVGRKYIPQQRSRFHELSKFNGIPCPFLKDSVCSIYADRPFACRKHVSFHTSNYWCKPERSQDRELPLVGFTGIDEAYADVSGIKANSALADIRDFFPSV